MSEERSWRALYRIGAIVAVIGIAALMFDIVLSMLPGWGPATVPTTVDAWLAQFGSNPLLGMRNLDSLNVLVSLITLPMYVALYGLHRKSEPALLLLGLIVVSVGTVLFASSNAALSLLGLSRDYAVATTPVTKVAIQGATQAALVRGAHGSFGVLPAFLLSEIGTLIVSIGMIRGGVFRRAVGITGVVGSSVLALYTIILTTGGVSFSGLMMVAALGGLLMIGWQVAVSRTLLRSAVT